ncbi:MAG: hypothetical protein ACJAV5_000639 [Vicingaceae bacterium]
MKKILLPLASAFLAYQFYQVIAALWINAGINVLLGIDFLITYIIALFGTGIFTFIGFAYPTSILIGNSYYRIKSTKQLQFWYYLLGVSYFRKFLMLFFWGSKKNQKKYFNRTRIGIDNFIYQTHQSEFGHLGALVLVAFTNMYAFYLGYYAISIFLFVINIVGNLYPIILQRHHRIRLEKFIR